MVFFFFLNFIFQIAITSIKKLLQLYTKGLLSSENEFIQPLFFTGFSQILDIIEVMLHRKEW
jgi:hypothetical protein